ncbi:MAG: hypothetical protein HQM12_03040 [SAR324 cluster bacterium]|nr:hypothetical protein [SAR324 cluster bacterium]
MKDKILSESESKKVLESVDRILLEDEQNKEEIEKGISPERLALFDRLVEEMWTHDPVWIEYRKSYEKI